MPGKDPGKVRSRTGRDDLTQLFRVLNVMHAGKAVTVKWFIAGRVD